MKTSDAVHVQLEAAPNHQHRWVLTQTNSVSYSCPLTVADAVDRYGAAPVLDALRAASRWRTAELTMLRDELRCLNEHILAISDEHDMAES